MKVLTMIKLDKNKLNILSNDIFEYTIINHIVPDDIAREAKVPVNDVRRLQSENPFVSEKSFALVRDYMDRITQSSPKTGQKQGKIIDKLLFDFWSDGDTDFTVSSLKFIEDPTDLTVRINVSSNDHFIGDVKLVNGVTNVLGKDSDDSSYITDILSQFESSSTSREKNERYMQVASV